MSQVSLSIPGLTWPHMTQATAIAATAGALRIGTRLLPVALTGSYPIDTVLSTGLASLVLLPCLENRPLSSANMKRLWSNIPYSSWVGEKLAGLTQRLNGQKLGSELKKKITSFEMPDGAKSFMKKGLEGGTYLALASAAGSIGIAILHSKSWMAVIGQKGVAIAAYQLAALGVLQIKASLENQKLGSI